MLIRPWTDSDTEQVIEWFDFDPIMWKHVGFDHVPTVGDVHNHFLMRATQEIAGSAVIRAVELDGELIGYLSLYPHLPTHSVCHIILSPWHRGKGIRVMREALKYGRDELGLKRIVAPAMSLVDPKVYERWLRLGGFEVKYYGEWNA